MQLIYQYLQEAAIRHHSKELFISGTASLTYSDFTTKVNALAELLILEGLHKGERALILFQDDVDLFISSYAVMRAGGVAVPLWNKITTREIQDISAKCLPWIFISSHKDLRTYPGLRNVLNCPIFLMEETITSPFHFEVVVNSKKNIKHSIVVDPISKLMQINENDPALLFYDTNWDVDKKEFIYTQHSLIQHTVAMNERINRTSKTVEMILSPTAHINKFLEITQLLFKGCSIILSDNNISGLVNLIIKNKCDTIFGSEETFSVLLEIIENISKHSDKTIQQIKLEGNNLSSAEKKLLMEKLPHAKIYLFYSIFEVPECTMIELNNERKKINTLGKPNAGVEILSTDEHGFQSDTEQYGEIRIIKDHLIIQFESNGKMSLVNAPSEMQILTDDYGFIDKEGYLHLIGKKSDMIDMGNIKISPYEVEEKIHEVYPDNEICVIGIPDPMGLYNEIPVLCYIAFGGKTIIPSELSKALASILNKNMIPRIVFRMDNFPRTGNKISRTDIKKQLMERMAKPELVI